MIIPGYWKDTGNVVDMVVANRMVLESAEPRLDGAADPASELIGRDAEVRFLPALGHPAAARRPTVTSRPAISFSQLH
jgi:hypothetical protein